jgi:hypothetical protein
MSVSLVLGTKIALIALGVAGAGAATGAVLVTSGPFSGDDDVPLAQATEAPPVQGADVPVPPGVTPTPDTRRGVTPVSDYPADAPRPQRDPNAPFTPSPLPTPSGPTATPVPLPTGAAPIRAGRYPSRRALAGDDVRRVRAPT